MATLGTRLVVTAVTTTQSPCERKSKRGGGAQLRGRHSDDTSDARRAHAGVCVPRWPLCVCLLAATTPRLRATRAQRGRAGCWLVDRAAGRAGTRLSDLTPLQGASFNHDH